MVVSLIIDIFLASICFITIIRNAVRGFIKSFIVMMKSVLALFLAYLFNAPLARGISSWIFEDLARGWVRDLMISTQKEGGYALYEIFDGIPEWFTKVSISQGIDKETVQHYFVDENLASEELVNELTLPLGDALSMLISTIISFLLIFIVIEIILIFVGKLLNRLSDLPIWKWVNIVLGGLMGAVISAVVVWFISTGIVLLFEFGSHYYPNIFSQDIIENTVILDFFGEYNMFTVLGDWFS